jgi:hypothetical protein
MYTITLSQHAVDHGVPSETLAWAVSEVRPEGFFLRTLTIPEGSPSLKSNLYGPAAGDPPVAGEVLVRQEGDASRGATPFVNLPPRETRLLTVIGIASGHEVTVFTAYGGPAAERIPSDPSLASDSEGRARAESFWAEHALSIAAKR